MSTTSRQKSVNRPNQNTRKRLVSVDGPGKNKGLIPSSPKGYTAEAEPKPKGAFGTGPRRRAERLDEEEQARLDEENS